MFAWLRGPDVVPDEEHDRGPIDWDFTPADPAEEQAREWARRKVREAVILDPRPYDSDYADDDDEAVHRALAYATPWRWS